MSENQKHIVFVHGFPFHREMWRPQLDARWNGITVSALDLPGFGDAMLPAKASMSVYAEALHEHIHGLNCDRVVVCGLSMGGYVALEFAETYPNHVAGLVLAGTKATPDSEQAKKGRFDLISKIENTGSQAVVDAMFAKLFCDHTREMKSPWLERIKSMMLAANPKALSQALAAMADRKNHMNTIKNLQVPVLVILGDQDTIIPVLDAMAMSRIAKSGNFIDLSPAGHLSNLECTEKFNQALRQFCEKI